MLTRQLDDITKTRRVRRDKKKSKTKERNLSSMQNLGYKEKKKLYVIIVNVSKPVTWTLSL
jgi:hypothetical protein